MFGQEGGGFKKKCRRWEARLASPNRPGKLCLLVESGTLVPLSSAASAPCPPPPPRRDTHNTMASCQNPPEGKSGGSVGTSDQGNGKGRSGERPMGTAAYGGKGQGKGKGRGEGRLGQGGRGRSKGGEKPMGTTAYGGKGSKGRAANGDRPVGAASCRREHHTMASCQPPPPPPCRCRHAAHHHQCGKCNTGLWGSGSPNVTNRWCEACSDILPVVSGVSCLCCVSGGFGGWGVGVGARWADTSALLGRDHGLTAYGIIGGGIREYLQELGLPGQWMTAADAATVGGAGGTCVGRFA